METTGQTPTAPDSIDLLLQRSLVPLRSLSPGDDDFSDLEPLARAIGSARIVQLGEQGHGAGAAFEARVRLIKFLHQRMGFDVVVWESGMFDLRAVNGALKGGTDPNEAAQLGIFTIWSGSSAANWPGRDLRRIPFKSAR